MEGDDSTFGLQIKSFYVNFSPTLWFWLGKPNNKNMEVIINPLKLKFDRFASKPNVTMMR